MRVFEIIMFSFQMWQFLFIFCELIIHISWLHFKIYLTRDISSSLAEEIFQFTNLQYNILLISKLCDMIKGTIIWLKLQSTDWFLCGSTQRLNVNNIVNTNSKKHLFHNISVRYHVNLTKYRLAWIRVNYTTSLSIHYCDVFFIFCFCL